MGSSEKPESLNLLFADLTFEMLREWAGEKIYQRGEGYIDRVSQLSRTADGAVAAWVAGTDDYATMIRRDEMGNLEDWCTCPYSGFGPCKHAVALVLAAADRIRKRQEFPLLDPEDDLYLELFDAVDDDFAEEDFEDIDELLAARQSASEKIKKILAGKKREELEHLLVSLACEFPEVARRIRETEQLATGNVGNIVRALRKEIRQLTAEDAWYNSWKGYGNLPDYSHVEQQLRALLAEGHGDAVLELGEELWRRGMEQVSMSDDDGATAMAISACMEVVLEALPGTRMRLSEQLLWLIDRELEDEYDLLPNCDNIFADARYTEQQWHEVIEVLGERLAQLPPPDTASFSATYHRERLLEWLVTGYNQSGRPEAVIPLLEREVEICENYEMLVATLLAAGERDRARHWCILGYGKTEQNKAGIAAALQKQLRKMAEEDGRLDLVCSYRAEDFFDHPSEGSYVSLREAAERVRAWPAVRAAALDYLQTGERPWHGDGTKIVWPLPKPEVESEHLRRRFGLRYFPDLDLLIEIALLEGRFDDGVAIYQEAPAKTRWGWDIEERLAEAVCESHPDLALQIWKSIADDLIAQVKPSAYQEAAKSLRRMRTVYEHTGRTAEWLGLIKELRTRHNRKRRLLEVLDRLENNIRLID